MRRAGIYALLILSAMWTALPAWAFAEEAAEERWEHKLCELGDLKERLANPPPRDPKIEKPDEPYKMSLKGASPQWVEQKYLAIVRLELPKPAAVPFYSTRTAALQTSTETRSPGRSDFLRDDATLGALQNWVDGFYLLDPRTRGSGPLIRAEVIERLVKFTPEDRRPAQADIDYFAGNTPFTWSYVRTEPTERTANEHQRVFHIPATTPELAERRARALLTLLDQGFSRTLQLALYDKLDRTC